MKWLPGATNGTVVAGGNGAGSLNTQLYYPEGVFVDSFGTVYVTDYGNDRVMKWLKNANNGSRVVGVSGSAGTSAMQLNGPSAIRFDTNGHMYVAEFLNNRVQKFVIDNTSC
jgi:sugar lactone lactonase YvrE